MFAYDMRGHGRSPGKRSFFDRIEVRLEAGTTGVATVACAGAPEAGASRRPTVDPLATVLARSVVTTVAVCRLRVRRRAPPFCLFQLSVSRVFSYRHARTWLAVTDDGATPPCARASHVLVFV